MKKEKLAESKDTLSQRVGGLEEREIQAYGILTEEGPVMQLGDLKIADHVWNRVPRYCLMFAIDLHECGYWGRAPEIDRINNDRALLVGGSIVSRWSFAEQTEFWIVTDTSQSKTETSVFVAHESM
jgi:hypothetical protein